VERGVAMPSKKAKATPHQVLIRLTAGQSEILSALAFLRGTSSTEIVRDEVVSFLDTAATSERVQRLVRERAEFEAEGAGKLRSIRSVGKPPEA
jgi:hypothetical protein